MHRKHIAAKKNKQRSNRGTKMVQSDSPHVPEFISRVANIPVVHSALGYATDAYDKAKSMSPPLIKRTWDTAEDTVNLAARYAIPVVQTFEKPIHAVDSLACKTLDKVEETIPMVNKTPDEIKTYVNDKLQPVQQGVNSAVSSVSGVADRLLDNPIGRLALNSMQFTVTSVHQYIDYVVPPTAGEDNSSYEVPEQPSQRMMWTVRRGIDAVFKVPNRLTRRAQNVLHDMAVSGLLAVSTFFEILQEVMKQFRELMAVGVSGKLHQLANFYRTSTGGKSQDQVNVLSDVIFLVSYFTNLCVDYIRNIASIIAQFPESQPVLYLRIQLSNALAVGLDFATRVVTTVNSGNVVEKTEDFLKSDFPVVHQAFTAVKNFAVGTKEKLS